MISVRQTLSFVVAMIALIFLAQVATAGPSKKTKGKRSYLIRVENTKSTSTSKKADASESPGVRKTSRPDRVLMKEARFEFEKKNYKKSLALYESIPQTSDYWAEALEERAWAHVHLKEHDQALALVKTLFAPPVRDEIGGEPYLLSTLIHLRLCNYDEIFKVMKRFKTDIRPRFEAMQVLAKSGETEASTHMIGRSVESGKMSRMTAGSDLPNLPRLFWRDAKMQEAFANMTKPGASDRFQNIVISRMRSLAQRDVKDIETVLRKLHLVEVEATGRMFAEQNLADAKKASPAIERNANTLVFPDDDNDVWLDELNSYRVNAKGCPAAATATTASASKGPQS